MDEIILESFPFDSMEVLNAESEQMEPDREYEASIFRKYFKMFLSNGVYYGHYKNYGENSMKVTANGGMNVKVATGAGLIEGADFENIEERIITLERPIANTRVDRIVVQFNASLDTRATKLIVKQGNGSTPATLQRDENIYEICIAEVTTKSTSNITAEDIVDKRMNKDVCGIVNSLISVDGEELYQEFQDYIGTISDNLMLKNQDNTCTGKITALGGLEGDLTSIKTLTGTITVDDVGCHINYPEGFNKDNCTIIGFISRNKTEHPNDWFTLVPSYLPNSTGQSFGNNLYAVLEADAIKVYPIMSLETEDWVIEFKLTLMKI